MAAPSPSSRHDADPRIPRSNSPRRTGKLFLLATAIGVIGGGLGFLFQKALRLIQVFGLGEAPGGTIVEAAASLSTWQVVAVPAAGGLLAALFLTALRGRRVPFGITDVMRLHESLSRFPSSAPRS